MRWAFNLALDLAATVLAIVMLVFTEGNNESDTEHR